MGDRAFPRRHRCQDADQNPVKQNIHDKFSALDKLFAEIFYVPDKLSNLPIVVGIEYAGRAKLSV